LGFEVEKGDRLRVQPRGCELQAEVRYLKQVLSIPHTPNCYSFIRIASCVEAVEFSYICKFSKTK
jgi:hypothetical protein